MNYLAHCYLSRNNPEIIIGNFIADAVKGKNYLNFQGDIRFGIILHRKIDTFTDHNKIVQNINKIFRPQYGKFAGAFTDILFDHFLAKNWNKYSDTDLKIFAGSVYKKCVKEFPEKFKFVN